MLPTYKSDGEVSLLDYLAVLKKRRWTVVLFTVITVIVATIATFKATPVYKATTRVLIEKENPNVVNVQEVVQLNATDYDYYGTQFKIIQSRGVAGVVMDRLNLWNDSRFVGEEGDGAITPALIKDSIKGWFAKMGWSQMAGNGAADLSDEDKKKLMIEKFMQGLEVEPVRNTRLVDISYKGHDPALITQICNALANTYIEQNFEIKFAASQQAIEWLNSRLQEMRDKVEEAERALQKYKESENLVSLEDRQNIVVQKLGELNSELTKAKTQTIAHETLYSELRNSLNNPDFAESIPSVINNPLIQNLKEEFTGLVVQYEKLLPRYKPKHPQMVRLKSEIEALQAKIKEEVGKILVSIETEYKVAKAREESLERSLEMQKREALELNQKAIQYGVLKRETESTKQLYDMLLNRVKETSLTSGLRTGNIRVLDAAEVPRAPVWPRKGLNLTLAFIFGAMVGTGFAFLQEYLDNTVKTPEDVEGYLNVHFLGMVPSFRVGHKKDESELITLEDPKSGVSEGFKNIRTNMMFASPDAAKRAFLLTSASPAEGKTLVVANLAVTMAQMGKRVLLIDADLRKPRLHKLFFLENQVGLSNVLIGEIEPDQALLDSNVPGLKIMTAGTVPPNPSELLSTARMEEMVNSFKERFDLILLDSPPVLTVTDPVVLSPSLDGVVMVVRCNETPVEPIQRALKQLKDVEGKVIGAILNAVEIRKGSYYYHYYYKYYSKYYGEDEE